MKQISGVTIGRSHNERFGASGGVAPQKELCKNESLCPATPAVSLPPSPSRWTLAAIRATVNKIIKKNLRTKKM
jgi:hypothetical protein